MILARRKTHLYSFIGLICILPLIFLIGVIFTPTYPLVNNSANQLFMMSGVEAFSNSPSTKFIGDIKLFSGEIKFLGNLFRQGDNMEAPVTLNIVPLSTIKIPDLLLYWHDGNDNIKSLDENSILLGSISGTSPRFLTLPSEIVSKKEGQLILYSQGYQEIVATFPFAVYLDSF